jgi:hypothetical protein
MNKPAKGNDSLFTCISAVFNDFLSIGGLQEASHSLESGDYYTNWTGVIYG